MVLPFIGLQDFWKDTWPTSFQILQKQIYTSRKKRGGDITDVDIRYKLILTDKKKEIEYSGPADDFLEAINKTLEKLD